MPNVGAIIEGDNKKKLKSADSIPVEKQCNCPKYSECPLEGKCLSKDIVYQAIVKCGENEETYVGLTATDFKARLANHKSSFKSKSKQNSTELSKHIWNLKERNLNYTIKWKILSHATHYSNRTKRCNLCITEKYFIICKPKAATLNKRNELISKCRHKDKFLLRNVK